MIKASMLKLCVIQGSGLGLSSATQPLKGKYAGCISSLNATVIKSRSGFGTPRVGLRFYTGGKSPKHDKQNKGPSLRLQPKIVGQETADAWNSMRNAPETEFYTCNEKSKFPKWIIPLAIGQLIIWLNLSDLSWNYMVEDIEDGSGETKPASTLKRGLVTAGLLMFGGFITAGMFTYSSRMVKKAKFVDYCRKVEFQTESIFRKKAVHTIPLNNLYTQSRLVTGKGEKGLSDGISKQWVISIKSGGYGFVLDRTGTFTQPRILDVLLLRK